LNIDGSKLGRGKKKKGGSNDQNRYLLRNCPRIKEGEKREKNEAISSSRREGGGRRFRHSVSAGGDDREKETLPRRGKERGDAIVFG